jgi:hypothetical protein
MTKRIFVIGKIPSAFTPVRNRMKEELEDYTAIHQTIEGASRSAVHSIRVLNSELETE